MKKSWFFNYLICVKCEIEKWIFCIANYITIARIICNLINQYMHNTWTIGKRINIYNSFYIVHFTIEILIKNHVLLSIHGSIHQIWLTLESNSHILCCGETVRSRRRRSLYPALHGTKASVLKVHNSDLSARNWNAGR